MTAWCSLSGQGQSKAKSGKRKREIEMHIRWVPPSYIHRLRRSSRREGEVSGKSMDELQRLVPIERERAPKTKTSADQRGCQEEPHKTKENNVLIATRLQRFPSQSLIESRGSLFCVPCKENIPSIKCSTSTHLGRCDVSHPSHMCIPSLVVLC